MGRCKRCKRSTWFSVYSQTVRLRLEVVLNKEPGLGCPVEKHTIIKIKKPICEKCYGTLMRMINRFLDKEV